MADTNTAKASIVVEDMTMAYGSFIVQEHLNFTINQGDIFIIMGGSGCGKSTVMRALNGMQAPTKGKVFFEGQDIWSLDVASREALTQKSGVVFQSSGLWSSMSLLENVVLPITQHLTLPLDHANEIARLKLALVGLAGFEDFLPSEISGGMQRRAGVARALALDPHILLFDEPSAGLDPVSSMRLDDLIVELKENLGTTIIIVTHELSSLLSIGTNSVFLDPETKTQIATGEPRMLRDTSKDPRVREFLMRGQPGSAKAV
jgi:phospholipid/cholesterol/gamma-HCH transport system ATP-binding protein